MNKVVVVVFFFLQDKGGEAGKEVYAQKREKIWK